jgi:hypothetical protein
LVTSMLTMNRYFVAIGMLASLVSR